MHVQTNAKTKKSEVMNFNCSSNCLENISGAHLAKNQNSCSCVENCLQIDFYGFSKLCFGLRSVQLLQLEEYN